MTNSPARGFNRTLTCAVECSDLEASIAWYQSVLGFELELKVDFISWAEMRTPVEGVTLGIAQVEEAKTRGGATLTWGVDNIDRTRAEIEKHGVRFDGETQTIPDFVRLATFFDPDGNTHMLYEDLRSSNGGQ